MRIDCVTFLVSHISKLVPFLYKQTYAQLHNLYSRYAHRYVHMPTYVSNSP